MSENVPSVTDEPPRKGKISWNGREYTVEWKALGFGAVQQVSSNAIRADRSGSATVDSMALALEWFKRAEVTVNGERLTPRQIMDLPPKFGEALQELVGASEEAVIREAGDARKKE